MPHKCVRCGNVYENAQLNGCTCGSQLFFFVKTLEEAEQISHVEIGVTRKKPAAKRNKKRIKVMKKITNRAKFKGKIETIHMKSAGVYEINLEALMKEKPVIVHEKDEKKYLIDLKSVFKSA